MYGTIEWQVFMVPNKVGIKFKMLIEKIKPLS